jgi:outer membrane protein insertion porin family
MKTALLSLATSLVLCGPLQALAQTPPPAEVPPQTSTPPAPRVSSIEIRGASDPSVVQYLTAKVGEPGDAEVIRSSVLLLSALDLFDEITVEQEIAADGTLGLVFKVVETPRLGEMRFVTRSMETGLDVPVGSSLSKALERAAGLRTREPFRDKALVDASARMTEWLRANAYPRATIEIEPIQDAVVSRHRGFIRDLRVRVLMPKQETLVSSRIDGWPNTLPVPKSPARLGEALTVERMEEWKQTLLELLWKKTYLHAQVKTVSVEGDLVFFVTPGAPFALKLTLLTPEEQLKARERFEKEGLSQDAIEETMSAIEADYVKRGYRDVDVDFMETPGPGQATGEFAVRLGPAWMLSAIEYQTNGVTTSIPEDAGLEVGNPWIDADVEAEKSRLRAQLIQSGHAGALVSHEESGEPGSAKVTFKMVPGSLTTIASVVLEGAPALRDRSASSVVELRTREASPFRNADVARDRTTLLASLRDDGYLDARVDVSTDFSDDRTAVAVAFLVTPGPRVRVGQILVVGLEDTKETVVLRESRLKEGDFLSYQKLLDTQAGLSATGLFTNVQIRELPGDDDQRDVIIELTEGPRTTIVPGLGYAEAERWRASVELTRLNISGLGRTASLFLRSSLKGSRALLSLTEPYAFGRRQPVNVRFYAEDDRSRDAFDFQRLGFQTQTVFPLGSSNLLFQYTFQKTTTTTLEKPCAEVNRDLCDGKISGPSLGFVYDTRSDALDPRRGTLLSVETLLSAAKLGGDSFVKGSVFIARYEEIRAGTVLAGSARLGLSRAFADSVELPLPERFFAGGASLMRGFKIDEVGPGRLSTEGVFVPSGGNALLAAAIEARFDITASLGFQIFAETGNVFRRVAAIKIGDLREVAGVGLRYRSPFGPLRLDWGFKLDRREGESLGQLHLGVGYAF